MKFGWSERNIPFQQFKTFLNCALSSQEDISLFFKIMFPEQENNIFDCKFLLGYMVFLTSQL